MKNGENEDFFKKNRKKHCQIKNNAYLCNRNRKQPDSVAQLVEQMTLNHWVESSSLSGVTKQSIFSAAFLLYRKIVTLWYYGKQRREI